jgi:hypothetical protein
MAQQALHDEQVDQVKAGRHGAVLRPGDPEYDAARAV